MRRLFLLVLAIAALHSIHDARAEDMQLSVKPVLCITDNRNPVCDLTFVVVWQSASVGYYCLFSDDGETPVRCWREARDGETRDERTVSENFIYWMAGPDATPRLAEVAVEVLHLDSSDRRRKRRTRHVWDIN